MPVPPDALPGVLLAADLVRVERRRGDAHDYAAVLERHGYGGPGGLEGLDVRSRFAAAGRLGLWARRLRTVFEAASALDRARAADGLLDAADVRVRLSGDTPAWLFEPGSGPEGGEAADLVPLLVARVQAVTAGALAWVLVAGSGERLGVCALPWCGEPFVDESRTGRRRYCSPRCGNTVDVRRHRERRAYPDRWAD